MNTFTPSAPQIILQQLGGNKFIAMTGVKNIMQDDHTALVIELPKNLSGARHLRIEITNEDTYRMIFRGALTKDFSFPIKATAEDVYVENIQEIFTLITGLQTRL